MNRPSLIILTIVYTLIFIRLDSKAQSAGALTAEVKDSIVTRYNRNDFKGIYRLADTSFSHHISEQKLVTFLSNNRNSGNIIKDSLLSAVNGKYVYLLECQSRDLKLTLQVTPEKKFTDFGFSTVVQPLLDVPKQVSSSNPLRTPQDRAVDSVARAYFRDPNSTALSIGIIRNGKRYTYHYGEIKKGSGLLPIDATVYEIGSITKTFTATLLAQAVLAHKVALDDDIRKYLPDDYPNLSFNGSPVTFRDLANHTSGLPEMPENIGSQPGFDPLMPELNYDAGHFYVALHRVKLDTVPGSKFRYSNWGYALLGHLLEKIYGLPYAVLLKKYITGPFGMKDTWYTLTPELKQKMAVPYSDNSRSNIYEQEGLFGPAGYIHSSIADLLTYLSQQISETDAAVRLTHQPTANSLGLGWGVAPRKGYRDIQHNGSTMGFNSHLSGFPELNSGCVILVNNRINMGKLIAGIQQIARRKDL
ncbi:CubicO group peptidase, beta-lactamase class C family [Mucilaginibacter pineti]|uniref:CubicO group peptidase, beta-lactamase class C family n=1 Tax=Mucilaginibacter pineti TaxID=1391627 RepID=A0A1G7P0X8_9SPHI|nr:serine hydrolase domain-containing protein [Mucilaginibacter pineti]SDF79972.1 CubicO group peptidase, beta-lactamase class C family [Mucilaginibacter pineti]